MTMRLYRNEYLDEDMEGDEIDDKLSVKRTV